MCLGIPGQIVAISDALNSRGIVSISGVRREINLHCVVDDEHPVNPSSATGCSCTWASP